MTLDSAVFRFAGLVVLAWAMSPGAVSIGPKCWEKA